MGAWINVEDRVDRRRPRGLQGARACLAAGRRLRGRGRGGDGDAAVEAAHRLRPQIVLLDVRLPGIDGFKVAERLAAGPDPPAVVLISSRGASTYRQRLRGSPARGFIAKAELSGECLTSRSDDRGSTAARGDR